MAGGGSSVVGVTRGGGAEEVVRGAVSPNLSSKTWFIVAWRERRDRAEIG